MDGDFRFLDDLEPTAPLDRVTTESTQGIGQLIGTGHIFSQPSKPAQYVGPFLYPDAFPVVKGPVCNCQTPPVEEPTDADKEWAAAAAKQLGMPVTLPNAPGARGRTVCTCKGNKDGASHWTRSGPTNMGKNFSLLPADATYSQGDYWHPSLAGNLASPADKLPPSSYPVQAPADHIEPVPSIAKEDYISRRYAKYVDQLEARKEACDKVSKRCTVPCGPGDQVGLTLGNTQLPVTIVSADPATNAFIVQFTPTAALKDVPDAKPCPLKNECTAFRMCFGHPVRLGRASETAICVHQKVSTEHNWKNLLERKFKCPTGTTMCSTIEQMALGDTLSLDGKACRVKPPVVKP